MRLTAKVEVTTDLYDGITDEQRAELLAWWEDGVRSEIENLFPRSHGETTVEVLDTSAGL